jgi:hypothetical protein
MPDEGFGLGLGGLCSAAFQLAADGIEMRAALDLKVLSF